LPAFADLARERQRVPVDALFAREHVEATLFGSGIRALSLVMLKTAALTDSALSSKSHLVPISMLLFSSARGTRC
jgi:hypothetical protein